jgi:sulfite reductase (NADPH) flavoprotein alpha-component
LASRPLNGPNSSKDTRHVELSLAGSGLSYEPGDVLGMWPVNDPGIVEAILDKIQAQGYEMVTDASGTEADLREALLRGCDLNTITDALLDLVPHNLSDTGASQAWTENRQVIDLLATWPGKIDPQALVSSLRPMQPRLYSISSSLRGHANQVHLTVGAVRYETHGRQRGGVASTFLADRAGVGNTVGIYLQHSPHFKLPEDPTTPIIMIGPGTGIAPFRSFLQERAAQAAEGAEIGPTWLFFGDQHAASDFLYEEELMGFHQQGVLSRLDTAFSRDQSEKIYVQNRLLEASADVWEYLENNGRIYICGDASRMAKDVHQALCSIIAEHSTDGDLQAADNYLTELANNNRYCRDVY